jgi:monofunctional biosynthetic peptidoglycan transglycosylase
MKRPRITVRLIGRVLAATVAGSFAIVVYLYLTLPDVRVLRSSNPATTAFMDLRAREARAAGKTPRHFHRWVNYGRISSNLTRAVLVAEDDAFWQHEGVDFEQLQESLEIDLAQWRLTRGASTITQQLAKNLYLSPSKNPLRKFRELLIARRLEAELKKARILEIYLNVIEWGDGIYGDEAAARTYFGTGASALTPSQAALLAGAIINPRVLSPQRPPARLLSRQQLILHRMGAVSPPLPEPVTVPPPELMPTPDEPEPIRADPSEPLPEPVPDVKPPVDPPDSNKEPVVLRL